MSKRSVSTRVSWTDHRDQLLPILRATFLKHSWLGLWCVSCSYVRMRTSLSLSSASKKCKEKKVYSTDLMHASVKIAKIFSIGPYGLRTRKQCQSLTRRNRQVSPRLTATGVGGTPAVRNLRDVWQLRPAPSRHVHQPAACSAAPLAGTTSSRARVQKRTRSLICSFPTRASSINPAPLAPIRAAT